MNTKEANGHLKLRKKQTKKTGSKTILWQKQLTLTTAIFGNFEYNPPENCLD